MTDISFPVRVIATGPDSYWTQDAAGTVRRYDLRGELFATVPAGPACDRIVAQLAERFPVQASTTPVADALQLVDQAGTEYGVPSAELLALRKLAGAVRSHGIGAELGQLRERRTAAPPVYGVTEHDGQVVIAVLPSIRDLAWIVATEQRGGGGPYRTWFAAVDDAAGHLGFEPAGGPFGSRSGALADLAVRVGIACVAPF